MNEIINGERQGLWKHHWIHSGILRAEGLYLNNVEDGLWKFYHGNGDLCSIGQFLNGQKFGLWAHYFENNILSSHEFYL